MSYLRSWWSRIVGMFTKDRADDDLRAEFEAHLEMETAEFVRRGMAPNEARRQALLASGGLTQAAEAVRAQRGLPWLESVGADFKYAVRSLRHSPIFTLVVVTTLALGIGANTAIFSVVRGVVLKPLPHRDGDRLVYLRHSVEAPGGENVLFSVPEVQDFRDGTKSFGGIAEYSPWSFTLRTDGDAVRVPAGLVTGNFFEVMGLDPILGRVTSPDDDGQGVPVVAVLTHEYWIRRFAADSGVIGKQLRLDSQTATVIGVLEPAPYFPDRVDMFLNMVASQHHLSAQMVQGRSHRMTEMIARLTPAATLEQARSEVTAVNTRITSEFTESYDPGSQYRVTIMPFKQALGARAQLTLWLLMGAAAFVMIIAAANVANLTLMRGVRREPELVARAALGAGAGRLRRLLLAENLLLTIVGGVLGILLAIAGVGLLISLVDRYSARAGEVRLDGVALGFTLLVSTALAIVLSYVGSLPKESAFAALISSGGRRVSGSVSRQRLQRGLVVAQVAVSVVLLAGAGLLTRTMMQLSEVQTGLRTEEVLSMTVPLLDQTQVFVPGAQANARAGYERILADIRAIPGVSEVGLGSSGPLRRGGFSLDVKAEGKVQDVGEATPRAEMRTANPEYFSAAGIPLVSGRPFAVTDEERSAKVVIINKMLADQLFPGEDPVGKRIAWTGEVLRFAPVTGDWRMVVGVVANTQDGGLDAQPRPVVFQPYTQMIPISGALAIRADSNVARLIPAVTRIVRRHAPNALIENVMTIAQIRDQSVAPRRLNAALVSSFGILAVIIAAVGIAGVLAFSVSARTNEIGIRMSLGADGGRVERMILREGGILLVLGLASGITAAILSARAIRGLLFGVEPHDPATMIVVAAVMGLIGLIACWIPALRASRIDPAVTMRAS
ncbi:MAG TPA: ABC transporter permease [Gemmatimonadaceae bacterium]|nr:ABC transporter permease [Gemmatimonadaceae bacterium]